ncbi:MAG TPA: uroporphyrinogen decarboxylase [Opitutaceae bacterium]|jgi:uroporphyrinogen decarboxylase
MLGRERFLAACSCRPLDRPPVWVMRQAGRYLPEYRELKAKHGFLKMVKTPELAAEVTLQPLRRFALDAAILFSDILVIPEALGQGYRFRDAGGIQMEYALASAADIDRLAPGSVAPERLAYVGEALKCVRRQLQGQAMLGFGGSPWTLATYMVEGGSSDDFAKVKGLFYEQRAAFERLMERLCDALIAYFRMQIQCGADAIQIFDSWGGALAGSDYEAGSLQWIRRIVAGLPAGFPIVLFAKGTSSQMEAQAKSGIQVLSFDAATDLAAAAARCPVAVQGNLDPVLLNTTPEIVTRETKRLLAAMQGRAGHILNLGHGILPEARIECMQALVETAVGFNGTTADVWSSSRGLIPM